MDAPVVSVVIPSRNEPFLQKTIDDLLSNSRGPIEIIAILDGYWPDPALKNDDRVHLIHRGEARGMRNGINSAVAISKGKYILKTDGHCMFDEGFDVKLVEDCKDDWVVIPRRYPLDAQNWKIEERTDDKYPCDYEYIHYGDLHGVNWKEKREERKNILIDETLSAQGSCWFMTKKHFENIEGLDEEKYGTFFLEFQEISFKTYSIGGKVMVNKKTWYAHYHKTGGRGYDLDKSERDKAVNFMKSWLNNTAWEKQKIPFIDIIERFQPMPTWSENWKDELR